MQIEILAALIGVGGTAVGFSLSELAAAVREMRASKQDRLASIHGALLCLLEVRMLLRRILPSRMERWVNAWSRVVENRMGEKMSVEDAGRVKELIQYQAIGDPQALLVGQDAGKLLERFRTVVDIVGQSDPALAFELGRHATIIAGLPGIMERAGVVRQLLSDSDGQDAARMFEMSSHMGFSKLITDELEELEAAIHLLASNVTGRIRKDVLAVIAQGQESDEEIEIEANALMDRVLIEIGTRSVQ